MSGSSLIIMNGFIIQSSQLKMDCQRYRYGFQSPGKAFFDGFANAFMVFRALDRIQLAIEIFLKEDVAKTITCKAIAVDLHAAICLDQSELLIKLFSHSGQ